MQPIPLEAAVILDWVCFLGTASTGQQVEDTGLDFTAVLST